LAVLDSSITTITEIAYNHKNIQSYWRMDLDRGEEKRSGGERVFQKKIKHLRLVE
jgi:hypothetical protein